MADRFTYDVFLSHNSKDKPRVRKLAEDLREAGLRVWFDEWVIKPGDDIYLSIERGLEAGRAQVLCLSPAALGSDWVALERSTVLFRDPTNAGRRFIPLLLADCEFPDTHVLAAGPEPGTGPPNRDPESVSLSVRICPWGLRSQNQPASTLLLRRPACVASSAMLDSVGLARRACVNAGEEL